MKRKRREREGEGGKDREGERVWSLGKPRRMFLFEKFTKGDLKRRSDLQKLERR